MVVQVVDQLLESTKTQAVCALMTSIENLPDPVNIIVRKIKKILKWPNYNGQELNR